MIVYIRPSSSSRGAITVARQSRSKLEDSSFYSKQTPQSLPNEIARPFCGSKCNLFYAPGNKIFVFLPASFTIQFLNLTILQNQFVNIFSAINTFPHPKVFSFIINLFVNHPATRTVAYRRSLPHLPPLLERESLIRIVELKIPRAIILSTLKMRL